MAPRARDLTINRPFLFLCGAHTPLLFPSLIHSMPLIQLSIPNGRSGMRIKPNDGPPQTAHLLAMPLVTLVLPEAMATKSKRHCLR